MANNSATGGYLRPTNIAIDGELLKDFFHDVIVGLTGLDNTLVRPAYQLNAPTIPEIHVNWCAFAILNRHTVAMPWYDQRDTDGVLSTNELFDCLVSFYGSESSNYASILRDGLQIQQNNDKMIEEGIAVIGTSDIVYLPELFNGRWLERSDITINLNRDLSRVYDILTLQGAEGTLYFDDVAEEDFNAGETI